MNIACQIHALFCTDVRKANAMRDEFLSLASHELRTPLTPLQLQLQSLARQAPALARDDAAAERLTASVATLQRQSDRLAHLVEELLNVSHQLAGEPPAVELEPVDLAAVVRALVSQLEQDGCTARARCTVETTLDPAIGRLDRLRVEQIATNLIENALKFGAGDKVEVGVTCDGEFATLRVTDHGIGIAKADHERIFERCERAVSARHYGGFGLGLWIARQAALALGGSIEVESEPGRGATFRARLPLSGPRTEPRAEERGRRTPRPHRSPS